MQEHNAERINNGAGPATLSLQGRGGCTLHFAFFLFRIALTS